MGESVQTYIKGLLNAVQEMNCCFNFLINGRFFRICPIDLKAKVQLKNFLFALMKSKSKQRNVILLQQLFKKEKILSDLLSTILEQRKGPARQEMCSFSHTVKWKKLPVVNLIKPDHVLFWSLGYCGYRTITNFTSC